MAKKKEPNVQVKNPPDPLPPDGSEAVIPPPQAPPPAQRNGAREPDVRWSVQPDKSTRIDVECFVNEHVSQSGERYEQVHTVVTRYFVGQDGTWVRHGNLRTHDIPVLQFLLAKAHAYALERRTLDSSMPF